MLDAQIGVQQSSFGLFLWEFWLLARTRWAHVSWWIFFGCLLHGDDPDTSEL